MDIDLLIRDLIIQGIITYTENGKKINSEIDGRISIKKIDFSKMKKEIIY